MNEAILTTSWDDGHPLDLKLADLLARYPIPAALYVPLGNSQQQVTACRTDNAQLLSAGARAASPWRLP